MNTHKETAHHIALQIEELGNQPQHHIELAIGAGAINDVVISPDEPVLSEDWLIDHLTDKPTRERQLSKASEALREDYDKGMRKCVRDIARLVGLSFGSNIGYDNLANVVDQAINGTSEQKESACPGEPVFTQEMSDDFKIPKVGSHVEIFDAPSGSYVKCEIICHHKKALFITVDGWDAAVAVADDSLFRPIDNRTDGQKVRDNLSVLVSGYVSAGEECDIQHYVDELMQSFSITLNKE